MCAMRSPVVGIIGGTGREGGALAIRLAHSGYRVAIGSRSPERAAEKAHELATVLRSLGLSPTISGAINSDVTQSVDILFLAVPYPQVIDAARGLLFRPETIVVDTSVPVKFEEGRAKLDSVESGSVSEQLRGIIPPQIPLVGAFKTIPAWALSDIDSDLDCDVFVCGDSDEAKKAVMGLVDQISDLRAADAGPLSAAGTLERMSVLAIDINLRYKIKASRFRVIGL